MLRRFAHRSGVLIDNYTLVLAASGVIILIAAVVPTSLTRRPLSLPMVLVAIGSLVFVAFPQIPNPRPRDYPDFTERATELGVLVSLLGAGLAIDRAPGWRSWATTWRLVTVGMVLTIAAVAGLGWGFLGLAPAGALLLGAVLAPTDPVLAADVQVGEPLDDEHVGTDDEDEVRFALTSEAGLNDGLAFPFVYAAVAAANQGRVSNWWADWALGDLGLRVMMGVLVGLVAGLLLARLVFAPPRPFRALADTTEGFIAIGAILVTYGIAEIAHGYGFLAVFVAAVTLRNSQRDHEYHRTLHLFTDQIEQLLSVGLLVLLGGAVATGVLSDLTWRGVLVALAVILVARPLSASIAMIGSGTVGRERRAIAFFGIRGIGSIYYLAYATNHAHFAHADEMWAVTVFTILVSIVVHGVTATPVMDRLDARRDRRAARDQLREVEMSDGSDRLGR
ncbi:MAG TPA: cation:proton antiporter [Ilumatobacter sp.]|nr:cation:proton antiporter [Ilumatobacter sp.]